MSKTKTKTYSDSMMDIKISWKMLKSNYKAFLATELFAIISFVLINIVMFSILVLIYTIIPGLTIKHLLNNFSANFSTSRIFVALSSGIAYTVFIAFMNCQYGLAYDIFSSGDMFAEFKSSFYYFKHNWWQYFLLSFFMGVTMYLPDRRLLNPLNYTHPFNNNIQPVIIKIIQFVFSLFLIILFSSTLPSVTAKRKFFYSFTESFKILKSDFKRITITWVIFFFIFYAPILLISIILLLLYHAIDDSIWLIVSTVILHITYIVFVFIGIPMRSLIATRIYNSVIVENNKTNSSKKDN